MLTARDEEPDRVAGLELGADDYVAKPFSPRELAARIKAILRRVEQRGEDEVLTSHDIVLRRDSRDVDRRGRAGRADDARSSTCSPCFLEHPGIVLSREKLLDLVWGMTYPGGTRTVDVHVAQLRRKLGDPRRSAPCAARATSCRRRDSLRERGSSVAIALIVVLCVGLTVRASGSC